MPRHRGTLGPALVTLCVAFTVNLGCGRFCEDAPGSSETKESEGAGAASPCSSCASGSVCDTSFTDLEAAGVCEYPPLGASFRGALQRGFAVSGFTSGEIEFPALGSASSEVRWNLGEDVVSVACGLFRCPPYIARAVEDDVCSARELLNVDACVVAELQSFEGPAGAFSYGSLGDPEETGPDHCGQFVQPAVGCWAYDGFGIVAASELVPVAMSSLSPAVKASQRYVDDCASPEARVGALCRLADADGLLGVCFDERCRLRCDSAINDGVCGHVEEEETEPETETDTDGSATPVFKCEPLDDTTELSPCGVGVCILSE